MIETNPFAQGEIRSEMSETASENSEANALEMVENDLLAVEYHLEHNYQFRRNVLSGLVEYKKTGEPDENFSRLTSEALNTIFIKAKREIPDDTSLKTDIKAYVESDIRQYIILLWRGLTVLQSGMAGIVCWNSSTVFLDCQTRRLPF